MLLNALMCVFFTGNIRYNLTSSIGFNGTDLEDLSDSSSNRYKECMKEAISVVSK